MRRGPEMARGEGNVPGEARRDAGAWPVMLSAVLLSGAVAAAVSAATVRFSAPEAPAIASVRLGEIAAAWAVEAAGTESTAADAAADARAWAAALESALAMVAEREGVVLLPARAVAAGAPDMSAHVEAALEAALAASRPGDADGADEAGP